MNNIIMPMIKKVIPDLIANDIIDIQPMTGAVGKIHTLRVKYSDDLLPEAKFVLVEESLFAEPGRCVVDVDPEVEQWIKTHAVDQWHAVSIPFGRYVVSEELFVILALRWS